MALLKVIDSSTKGLLEILSNALVAQERSLSFTYGRPEKSCSSFTLCRCSNHSLLIETGRHSKVDASDRKCSCCNKVEDEIHFSVECLLYDLTRNKFFKDFSININGVDMKDAFIRLFSSKKEKLLKQLAKFITACFEIRSHTLQSSLTCHRLSWTSMSFIKNIVNSFFLILFCYLGGFLFRVGQGNNAILYFFM